MVLMRSITLVVKYVDLKQTYYILFIHIRYASHDLLALYFSNPLVLFLFIKPLHHHDIPQSLKLLGISNSDRVMLELHSNSHSLKYREGVLQKMLDNT